MNTEKTLPNGFQSWQETHFEVVQYITRVITENDQLQPERGGNMVTDIAQERGTGGLYELAETLTDEFEALHKGRQWDGEFFDEMEVFFIKKMEDWKHEQAN